MALCQFLIFSKSNLDELSSNYTILTTQKLRYIFQQILPEIRKKKLINKYIPQRDENTRRMLGSLQRLEMKFKSKGEKRRYYDKSKEDRIE